MSKKSLFRGLFDKQHKVQAETLVKSERQHLSHIDWSLRRQFSWKKSVLVIRKTLGLFFNTLSADEKYPLLNRDNLLQHLQTQLSRKQNTFSSFFYAVWKSKFYFEHFEKNDDAHSWCLFDLSDSENRR